MGHEIKKQNDDFQADFDKIYAKGTWTKDEISMMKDLKKLIYYNKVICAMDEGTEYPGSDHMPDMSEMSFRRGRNPMNGQYMSRDMYRDGGYNNSNSGMYHYPDWPNSYDMSGRRYYDSEKEKAIHKLHHMMENTDDPERKNALKIAINELEMK